jgi:hypothetical protein
LCANTNEHPTDIVITQEGEQVITIEGEVCCGGETGQGIGDESAVAREFIGYKSGNKKGEHRKL